ncbi:MAG TPA: LamG domain-containing protein [Candidatus Omnitrophota bacterium]|nr:LamG domain-containing protein [Candidatus Omnitrophota bacterium]
MRIKNFKGSILFMAVMFMVAMVVFVVIFLNRIIYVNKNTNNQINSAKAFYIAEAGLHKAMWYLLNTAPDDSTDGSWRTENYPAEPGADEDPKNPKRESFSDGEYIIWVETSKDDILLTSQGTCNGVSRTIQQTITLNISASNDAVAWWKLDETEGDAAVDSSSNGNDGSLYNGPTWTTGQVDGALEFDGKDDYVEISSSESLNLSDNFSFSLWFQSTDLESTKNGLLSRIPDGPETTNYGILWNFGDAPGSVYFYIVSGELKPGDIAMPISDTDWHHIVYTYDGTTFSGYLDGVEAFSPLEVSFILGESSNVFRIGSFEAKAYFACGILDDVRVYNRALSAEEVKAIYNGTEGSKSITPVAGSWKEI